MPFLAAPLLGGLFTVGQALLFAASTAYQMTQARKMKAKMNAEAEKRKGFEATKVGQVSNLPVVYGRNKIGSTIVDTIVSSTYSHANHNNYVASDYEPTTGFNYNSTTMFVKVTAVGTEGDYLEDDGKTANTTSSSSSIWKDRINLTSVTTSITWAGVEIYTNTEVGTALKPYVALSLSGYLEQLSSFEVGSGFTMLVRRTEFQIHNTSIVFVGLRQQLRLLFFLKT